MAYILFRVRELNFGVRHPLGEFCPNIEEILTVERLDLENIVGLDIVKVKVLKIKEPFAGELRQRQ